MLRIASQLYTEAQQRSGLFEQMNSAYQAGRQFATSPSSAWDLTRNWLIRKERQRANGPGRWNCFMCGRWVPGSMSPRSCPRGYENKCVNNQVAVCPQCLDQFDRQFAPRSATPSQPTIPQANTSTVAPAAGTK